MSVISLFLCVWSKSPKHPFCVFEFYNCFISSISALQDSRLFLKLHLQVQKPPRVCDDLPSKKLQQTTIITTANTGFPKYSGTESSSLIWSYELRVCTRKLQLAQQTHHLPGHRPWLLFTRPKENVATEIWCPGLECVRIKLHSGTSLAKKAPSSSRPGGYTYLSMFSCLRPPFLLLTMLRKPCGKESATTQCSQKSILKIP